MTELTHMVLCWQMTGQYYKDIYNAVVLSIYNYPVRKRGFTEDDRGNFLLQVYQRIPGIIQRFSYREIQFEGYIAVILRLQFRTYNRKRTYGMDKNMIDTIVGCNEGLIVDDPAQDVLVSISDDPTTEIMPWVYKAFTIEDGRIVSEPWARRVLLLALKSSTWLEENHLPRICGLTGYRLQWLRATVHRLRRTVIERRTTRIETLRRRRNRLFLRVLASEYDMRCSTSESNRNDAMFDFQRYYTRMKKHIGAITNVDCCPTNNDISKELGVPKGTIDSGLYHVRRYLQRFESKFIDT